METAGALSTFNTLQFPKQQLKMNTHQHFHNTSNLQWKLQVIYKIHAELDIIIDISITQ